MTRARVGVLLAGGDVVPLWQLALVHDLAAFCEPVPLTLPPRGGGRPAGGGSWPYRLYRRADRARFGSPDDALAPRPLEAPPPAELVRGSHELDLLLCLAHEDQAAALAPCARHGSWVLSVDDGDWPLWALRGDPEVASVTLRAFTPDGGGRVLRQSFTRLDPLSAHRTLAAASGRAARLALRQLRRPAPAGAGPPPGPSASAAGSVESARRLLRLARRALRHRAKRLLGADEWYLAYRRLDAQPPSPGRLDFTALRPPPDRYYADPFVTSHAGRDYVLFEDYRSSTGKGVISYVELAEDGGASAPALALELDCHLSYPFVLADGDRIYMVPETRTRRTVELHRAVRFPERWELERVLLRDVAASDATLLHHEGRWWLFAAVAEDGGAPWDELFLFSAPSLDGEWTPHPQNPVVSDIRRARPAGRILSRDGELIRPAQDCSRAYGWRTTLNRIERLDETGYDERTIGRIEPAPGGAALRTHSYTAGERFEAVDGLWLRPRAALGRRSAGRLGRFRIEA